MAGHEDTDSVVIGRGHNFLRNLKKIDDGLTSTDIQKLCFLCKDFDDVPWKELTRFKKGTELFSALKKAELLTEHDVSLLLELLEAIKRRDLIKKVKHFWPDALVRKSRLSPYRKLLLDISDNTTKSDLTDMKAISDLPYSMDDNTNTIEFFIALEAHGYISSDNVSFLNEILENKQMKKKVQNYVGKHPQTTLPNQPSAGPSDYPSPGLMSNYPSDSFTQSVVSPSGLDLKPPEYYSLPNGHQQPASEGHGDGDATGLAKPFKELSVSKHDEELGHADDNQVNLPVESEKQHAHEDGMMSSIGNQKMDELNRQDSRYDTNRSIVSMTHKEQEELSQIGGENLPVVSHNASDPSNGMLPQTAGCEEDKKIRRSLGRCYRMTANPSGICLIINNDKFHADQGTKLLKDRMGSEKDVEKLLNCFYQFNFEVTKKDNLTTDEMFDELNKVRMSPDLPNHDAFVCCILTHGKMGQLAGSNSKYLKIQEIVSLFAAEKCKHLAGKPKMFFIQACLGRDQQSLQDIETDCPRPIKESGIGFGLKETVPNQSDFLLGFATVPGYVSYRSRTTGSWYIPALVDALIANYLEEDLLSILTIVNGKLAHATATTKDGDKGQVPAPVTTLRKKVFFHRKEAVEYT